METIDIRKFESSFAIHFGCQGTRINAYTLASTLVAIADAAKAANSAINPGYEIEIVVEAFGEGSFIARVKALYHAAGNLFTADNLREIVLAIIAAYIYEHTLAQHPNVKVVIETNEVVIEQGDTRVIVPREVHESVKQTFYYGWLNGDLHGSPHTFRIQETSCPVRMRKCVAGQSL